MQADLDADIAYAGVISMTVSSGAIAASLMSEKIVKRFGTGFVTAASVFITGFFLAGFSFTPSFIWLVLLALLLELGAGAVDAAVNNYVWRRFFLLRFRCGKKQSYRKSISAGFKQYIYIKSTGYKGGIAAFLFYSPRGCEGAVFWRKKGYFPQPQLPQVLPYFPAGSLRQIFNRISYHKIFRKDFDTCGAGGYFCRGSSYVCVL